jgi:hypothetical protein
VVGATRVPVHLGGSRGNQVKVPYGASLGTSCYSRRGGGGVTTTPYVLVGTKEGTEPVGRRRSTQMKKPNVRVTGAEWASP